MIKLENKSVLLLSASETRRFILQSLSQKHGFNLSLGVSGFAEDLSDRECPLRYVQITAKQKLMTFLETKSDDTNKYDMIISADTIISFNNKIIEKPESHVEALKLLQSFKNNKPTVITAVCICVKDKIEEFNHQSILTMNDYTDVEIDSYLKSVPYMTIAAGINVDVMLEMGMIKDVKGEMDAIRGFPVNQFLEICQQH